MECPFELPVKKVLTHVNEAGCKYQVQIVAGKRALAAYLTKDEADYIVQAINSHEKKMEAIEYALGCGVMTETVCKKLEQAIEPEKKE